MYGVLGLTPLGMGDDDKFLNRTMNFTNTNGLSSQMEGGIDTTQLKKRSTLMKNNEIIKFSRDLRKIQNRTSINSINEDGSYDTSAYPLQVQ